MPVFPVIVSNRFEAVDDPLELAARLSAWITSEQGRRVTAVDDSLTWQASALFRVEASGELTAKTAALLQFAADWDAAGLPSPQPFVEPRQMPRKLAADGHRRRG